MTQIDNIMIVSASAAKKGTETILEKSIKTIKSNLSPNKHIETYITKSNSKSIASIYNKFIDSNIDYLLDDTAVIFVHDDVHINCVDLHWRLSEALNQFDVVGLAGSKTATIKNPALWHLMSDRPSHVGAVAHSIDPHKKAVSPYYVSSFGPLPSRALLIDGLFIATTIKVLKSVRFDESNPARFHYYDLAFSLDCNAKSHSIGVWDIPVVHMSPGLSNPDKEWEDGQEWFINKWGK